MLFLPRITSILWFSFFISWEHRKLGDIGKTYGGLSGKAKEDFGHGDAKFVTYMNVFSNPVGDPAMTEAIELDSRQNEIKKGDIFFTTSSETPDEVGMSSVWMENMPNTYLNSFCFGYRPTLKFDLYYLAYVLRSDSIRNKFIFLAQGISRYNISKNKVMEMSIPIPSMEEQVFLGKLFKNLDNLITLHQRKQNGLNLWFLSKKCTSNLANEWEQRKLGEYFEERNERSGEGELISVTINSGIKKFNELGRFDTKPEDLSKYKRVEVGDIAYNSMRMWQGASGYSPYSGILSPAYTVISPKMGVSSLFFAYLIKRPQMIHLFEVNSQGLTSDTWNLKFPAFSQIETSAPVDIYEQENIAHLFTVLDNLITLHQCKEKSRIAHADKKVMFHATLKLANDWEQRKLGEIAIEVNRTDANSNAPIMMITANDGFIEQSERYAFNNAGESLKRYIVLQKGELAYNHGASKLRPYGSCFALIKQEKARIPFVYHCFSVENHNPEFVSIELNGNDVESQLRRIVSSGARMDGLLNISFQDYASISILLPEKSEQDKIASVFRNLDNLITLHQREQKDFSCHAGEIVKLQKNQKLTDDWEQCKLGDIVSVCSGKDYKHLGEGDIPVYGTGGYMLSVSDALSYSDDAIGIGRKGTIDKPYILKAPFWTVDTLFYAVPKEKKALDFVYCLFQIIDWKSKDESTGVPSLSKIAINSVDVSIPKSEEQVQIGTVFLKIDNLITLHQRGENKYKRRQTLQKTQNKASCSATTLNAGLKCTKMEQYAK